MKHGLLILLSFFASLSVVAQSADWSVVERGNRLYRQGHYAEAEKCYLQVLHQAPDNATAHYNLGCAYLAQQNTEAALKAFEDAARLSEGTPLSAQAWHNIGVIHQGQAATDVASSRKFLQEAAEAYKESLRLNPSDEETRYNLALCQYQLRNDEQNNQEQQEEQEQEQNQQQDQPEQQQDPTQQLLNLARRAEDDTRQKINQARSQQDAMDKNW